MAYVFPDHMCTRTQTHVNTQIQLHKSECRTVSCVTNLSKILLILKRAEVFFQWECENNTVTPELSVSTLCLLLTSSHLFSTLIPLHFLTFALTLLSLVSSCLPSLPFSVFVSFFLPLFCQAQTGMPCCYMP